MSFLNGDALLGEDFVELRAALRIVPIDLSASCYPKRPADTDSALAHGFQTEISMNSSVEQGEIVTRGYGLGIELIELVEFIEFIEFMTRR